MKRPVLLNLPQRWYRTNFKCQAALLFLQLIVLCDNEIRIPVFKLVKRENELHQEILAFSISHDHRIVRIYGHYPIIDRNKTTFYRHPIHTFDFTALDGREKRTAYKFTKNVYDIIYGCRLT